MVSKKNFLIKNCLVSFSTAFILLLRNSFLLIFYPYKTMRKIAIETDFWQIFLIFFFIFIYFKFVYFLRDNSYPASFTFFIFLFNFFIMIFFFYFLVRFFGQKPKLLPFVFTFSYSLLPTFFWFISVSFLYLLLPPPRTVSFLGQFFSIFFITYSLSLLLWKVILFYLALRFSTKLGFYRIIYMITLFILWFIPYSVLLYYLKIFRVPFI